jgi:hypothetical protein
LSEAITSFRLSMIWAFVITSTKVIKFYVITKLSD